MCLYLYKQSKEQTETDKQAYIKRLKRYPYAWKVICVYKNNWVSQYRYNIVVFGKWLISSRKKRKNIYTLSRKEWNLCQVKKGFHVYTTREEARSNGCDDYYKVVKVQVDPETLVAVSPENSCAVFHKIKYLKEK